MSRTPHFLIRILALLVAVELVGGLIVLRDASPKGTGGKSFTASSGRVAGESRTEDVAPDAPRETLPDTATAPADVLGTTLDKGSTTLSGQAGSLTSPSTSSTAVPSSGSVVPVGFFASPSGSSSGDGSVGSPLDLGTALSSRSPVGAGQTLWLRGGVYAGSFVSVLSGRADAPVVVRAYPGERPVIDSGSLASPALTVKGSFSWFWGLEVMKSDPGRVATQPDSSDIPRSKSAGVDVYGPGTKLIGMVVHDNSTGVGLWSQAANSELYGLVIYNNGWMAPNGPHGHGIYLQNQLPSVMRITNCVLFNNYNEGLQVYATNGWAQGVVMDGVTVFGSGLPAQPPGSTARIANLVVGSENNPVDQVSVSHSSFYQDPGTAGASVRMGYGVPGKAFSFTDSTVAGGGQALVASNWQQATVTGNVFQISDQSRSNPILARAEGVDGSASRWDLNHYFGSANADRPYWVNGTNTSGSYIPWATWLSSSRFDGASTYTVGVPGTPTISAVADGYDPGRGMVTVFNWAGAPSVTVDVSSFGLRVGQAYVVRDMQNLPGPPMATGVYDGSPITVPLGQTTVTSPIGGAPVAHTANTFTALLVTPA